VSTSVVDEDKRLREAYEHWRKGEASIRRLARKTGIPKSSLQRKFGEMEELEQGKFGEKYLSKATDEVASRDSLVTQDPEVQQLASQVNSLQARVTRAEKLISLGKKKKQLEREALEAEARLDQSNLPNYVLGVIDEDYPNLTVKLSRLSSHFGMKVEDAIDEAFQGSLSYEDWAYEETDTFEDFVTVHLRDWVATREELIEEERRKAEEKKRLVEQTRRRELEEELRRMMPRLRCPLCKGGGRIASYAIVTEEPPLSDGIYFRCAECLLYYALRWIVRPFGQDEAELDPMPFGRVPRPVSEVWAH
jgi:hypothetical protein